METGITRPGGRWDAWDEARVMAAAAAAIHRGKPSRVVWAVARLANKRELEMAHSSDAFQSHPPPSVHSQRITGTGAVGLSCRLCSLNYYYYYYYWQPKQRMMWMMIGVVWEGGCSLHAGGAFICHYCALCKVSESNCAQVIVINTVVISPSWATQQ